ncbi:MAG: hypothetical protein Q9225_007513, partial [Loekoesia sp. 1 TL-2023]
MESASSFTTAGSIPSSSAASTTGSPGSAVANDTIRKGLAVGLGVTLGLAAIGATFLGLYSYNQRRRGKVKEAQTKSETPDTVPDSLPAPPAELVGYTEWEMATERNKHEAPNELPRR